MDFKDWLRIIVYWVREGVGKKINYTTLSYHLLHNEESSSLTQNVEPKPGAAYLYPPTPSCYTSTS